MLSRRAFILRSVGAGIAFIALPPQALLTPQIAHARPGRNVDDPAWAARHGLTSAQYQAEFDNLVGQGFRLVDVCGYESGGQALYAGIWEQSAGPAWVAHHGMTGDQYQSAFDDYLGEGFRVVRVSGYEVGGQDYYAAIWEQTGGPAWQARHGLTGDDYQDEFDDLVSQGYRPVEVCGYEGGGQPRFAAIWEQSGGPALVARHGLSSAAYQAEFNNLVAQGYRLIRVSGYEAGGDDHYAAIFEQTGGLAWQARHGIPGEDYQTEFDQLLYQGYRPLQVSGYAVGGGTNFAGIWENRSYDGSELSGMEGVVDAFMKKYDVPGLSLAITKDGRLVYARGFGVANKATGDRVTTNSLFRIASVSKPITSVAIFKLIEQNKLKLSDTVFGSGAILGTTYGTQPYKTNIDKITVQHLLEHTAGGWPNDGNDPMFTNPTFNHTQLISWVLNNRALDRAPGADDAYSNFGYCVLGRVIEKVTGQTYENWVQQNILAPSGATTMELAGNAQADRLPDEVVYYGQGSDNPYGMQVTRMDSHGGWLASAIDLVRFAVKVDGFSTKSDMLSSSSITTMTTASSTNAGYAKGWAVNSSNNRWHNGSLPGTSAVMVRTGGGLCWAALINTRRPNSSIDGDLDQMMWDVQGKVSGWPGYDLF